MKLTILNASGLFDSLFDHLEHHFTLSSNVLCAYFDSDTIDVTISPYESGEAPSSGIGGWAINRHRIEILLDTERHDVENVIRSELASVLAHEVNHIERMKLKLPGDTLAENLIYEGLACHFEMRFNGGHIPSLFKGMDHICWLDILEEMKPILSSKDFHFPDYFYCDESDLFPQYAGYWVGFNLVAQYINKHQISDEIALGLPADVFFENAISQG
ncbi:DUF2268 domain-containing protein [Photobacterium japonica]|uniref:DUF2268 domain-containing putative Zn-dependent protease n=1 Tax=Photobacterium japonica TaxID=2910235 RepID=UPI003D0C489C